MLRNINDINIINNVAFDNEYDPVTSDNRRNTRRNVNTVVANGMMTTMVNPYSFSAIFTGLYGNNYMVNNHKRGFVNLYEISAVASFDVLRDYYLMLCHPQLHVYQIGCITQQMVADPVFFDAIDNIPLSIFAKMFMNACSIWWLYYPLRMLNK